MSDVVAEERYRHRADPLGELIWHWGMAYRIWSAGGTWYARRRDRDEIMQAGDAERLSFVIRDDYFRRDRPAAPSPPPDRGAAGP